MDKSTPSRFAPPLSYHLQFFASEDRSEPATPRKRQKAREEGQVAKSQDLDASTVILTGLVMILILGAWWNREMVQLFRDCFNFLNSEQLGREGWLAVLQWFAFRVFLLIWLPLAMVTTTVAVSVLVAQVGLVITSKPLVPNFNRFNPVSGMKKIFSLRSLVELVKGSLKALILMLMLYSGLKSEIAVMVETIRKPLSIGWGEVAGTIWWLALKMALLLFVLALFDYAYQKWEHERNLKMSKKEIRDEYKQMEGDPKVKQRIRQRQRELARKRMMADVPKADVVITNPTTYAIALQYDKIAMNAPAVIAKGRGVIARRIREIAEEHDIPIVENRTLARTLYDTVEIGEEIPETLYKAVAEILAFVYKLKDKK